MARAFTLLDGGMGKLLLAQGAPFAQPEWSALALMEDPSHVSRAHRAFVEAGADVLITSSYAVVPFHLGQRRFDERGEELASLAARLARDVADEADRSIRVAGSIPPLFGSYEPDKFDPVAAPPMLAVLADAMAPYVDLFLPETQSILSEAEASIAACRPHAKPMWLAVTLRDDLVDGAAVLRSGETVTEAARLAGEHGIEALIFNCSRPEMMLAAVVEARSALPDSIAVGVYANSFVRKPAEYAANGMILEHRTDLDGETYARFVAEWLDAGAEIVGGCCGIMPSEIAHLDRLR